MTRLWQRLFLLNYTIFLAYLLRKLVKATPLSYKNSFYFHQNGYLTDQLQKALQFVCMKGQWLAGLRSNLMSVRDPIL